MKCCKQCQKELGPEQQRNRFCGRSCSATWSNRKFPKRTRQRTTNCLNCGQLNQSGLIYCSNRCQQALRWKKTKEEIERQRKVFTGSSRLAKKYLVERYGSKCQLCGISEWIYLANLQPVVLILDHIDGDADNWLLNNLRLVCGICDTFLPTYKAKNLGRGRDSKRQRYRTQRYKDTNNGV